MTQRLSDMTKKGSEYALPDDWPVARAEDVENPGAVVKALYDVISGPADFHREWDRFRSLCLPGAQFILTRWATPGEEREGLWEWDVEGFVAEATAFYRENGCWEKEVGARLECFGDVAHVFSTYASWIESFEGSPVARGINSVQLVRFRERWWIANVCWDMERPHNPIPEQYLDR
jgi:hypothetical protein